MKELYNILKEIEARPAMWIGESTLNNLDAFLAGYSWALCQYGFIDLNQSSEPSFNDWVAQKLGFYESTAGWHRMILAVTIGLDPKTVNWDTYQNNVTREQHEQSIKNFYVLLELYVQEYGSD